MAEAALVAEDWEDVQTLRGLLEAGSRKPLLEALFTDEDYSWRLIAVFDELEQSGRRPLYQELERSAETANVDPHLLARLHLLDAGDPEVASLGSSPVADALPPRRFDVFLPLFPTLRGALIYRSPHYLRAVRSRLVNDVRDSLHRLGADVFERTKGPGWNADFGVHVGDDMWMLVETKMADRRDSLRQVRETAGLANLSSCPVILVLSSSSGAGIPSDRIYGVVPTFVVRWEDEGQTGLQKAMYAAESWIRENPDIRPAPFL